MTAHPTGLVAAAPQSTNLDRAQLLDGDTLARLAELDPGNRQGFLDNLLRTYRRALEQLLAQLTQAQRATDRDAMRHVAHTLKSSSAGVGALALAGLCVQLEICLRDQTDSDIDALVSELLTVGRRLASGLARLA
jgi:HPt (histidine-containing phosphotransfer) domain-containing protein